MSDAILYEVDGFKITNLVIGKGMTGTCYKCVHDKIKERICAKVITLKPNQEEQVKREASVLQKLQRIQNDYITKVFHITQKNNYQYIFMEECVQGDLNKLIIERKNSNSFFSVEEVLLILKQLIRGYKILYFQQIIHRDLKPSNILIGNNGFLQITDYGSSKILNDMESAINKSAVGTPIYQAPQFFFSSEYSSKCDIYSLGVIVFQLLYGYPLIQSQGWNQLYEQLQKMKEAPLKIPLIPQQQLGQKEQNEFIVWFLQNSLQYEEANRLSWNDLFKQLEVLSIFQTKPKQVIQEQEYISNIKPTTYYQLQLQNSTFIILKIVQLILIKNSFVEKLKIKQDNFFKNNLMVGEYLTSDFYEYSKMILEGYQHSLFLNLHHFLFQNGRKELKLLQLVQELQNTYEYQVAQFISQSDYEAEYYLSYIKQFYMAQKINLQKQLNELIKKKIQFDLGIFFERSSYLNYFIFIKTFKDTIEQLMQIHLDFENAEFIQYIGFSIRFLEIDTQFPMASFLIVSSSDILFFPDDTENLQKYIENIMKQI